MEEVKALNVAIVGGGPKCKAIMDVIFGEKPSQLQMNLIGIAFTNPEAVGYRYAQEKGIYTTEDYRDLYKLKDLNIIIELTGRDEVASEISRTKPDHVRLIDHVAVHLFWNLFRVEAESIAALRRAEEVLRETVCQLQLAYDQAIIYGEQLNKQIRVRKRADEALRKRKEELKAQARNLEEMNTALKVLLKHREEDKVELEEKVLANVKELVLPYVEALKNTRLGGKQVAYASIIESHLNDIISPFLRKLSSKHRGLTPKEIQVACFIKEGKTTKEIAGLLNASVRAVEFHRENIRAKLGLKNKKANLKSYLLTLQ